MVGRRIYDNFSTVQEKNGIKDWTILEAIADVPAACRWSKVLGVYQDRKNVELSLSGIGFAL